MVRVEPGWGNQNRFTDPFVIKLDRYMFTGVRLDGVDHLALVDFLTESYSGPPAGSAAIHPE